MPEQLSRKEITTWPTGSKPHSSRLLKLFPKKAVVACQGVAGSYSQAACERLFEVPSIMFFNSFEGVFNAVEKGLCQYGILPIENSSYGSVGAVYDLMQNYNFHIVRGIRQRISHNLMAKAGTKLSDVKEIVLTRAGYRPVRRVPENTQGCKSDSLRKYSPGCKDGR